MNKTISTIIISAGFVIMLYSLLIIAGEPETISTTNLILCEDAQGNQILNTQCYEKITNPKTTKAISIAGIGTILIMVGGADKALNSIVGKK